MSKQLLCKTDECVNSLPKTALIPAILPDMTSYQHTDVRISQSLCIFTSLSTDVLFIPFFFSLKSFSLGIIGSQRNFNIGSLYTHPLLQPAACSYDICRFMTEGINKNDRNDKTKGIKDRSMFVEEICPEDKKAERNTK